jgi:hypothetical protein
MRPLHPFLRALAVVGVLAFGLASASRVLAQEIITIEQAQDQLELGEYFSVVAVVSKWMEDRYYTVEDDTGEMYIYVTESLEPNMQNLEVGDRLQLFGQWDDNPLEPENKGMRVWKMRKLGTDLGGSGAPGPAEATAPVVVVPTEQGLAAEAAPAAPRQSGQLDMIRPKSSEALKRKVRSQMQAYRAAEAEALSAGEDYARAAREAGSNGQVDPAVVERLDASEARVVEIRSGLAKIIAEARAAGVDESIIEMIEMEAGVR